MSDVALAFDFGLRRIGIAVGNTLSGRARSLTTLHYSDNPDWNAIAQLVAEWRPGTLVVGLPLLEDGTEQPITDHARAFIGELQQRFELPVQAVDERYSSIEAADRLRSQRAEGTHKRRVQKGDSDAVAAEIILETWLESA